jgi:uncharacterized protein YtpQ (UPF0354 family)
MVVSRLLLSFLTLLVLTGVAAAENLSPRAFTDAFAAAVTAAMPSAKVTIAGDLHLETRTAGGKTMTTDLHNAYERYLSDPEHSDAVIKRYLAVLIDAVNVDAKAPPDRARIVPVLKSTRWVEAVQQQRQGAPAAQLLMERLNSELTIVYAEDLPTSVRYLMMRDDVGDRRKLLDLALANLHRLLKDIKLRQAADGIFLMDGGDSYNASLSLAADIWSSGEIKVDGDIVVAVPTKDALLVTGSHNQAGVARLRTVAAGLARGPYGLTPVLFAYRGGKFVKFDEQ